MWFVLKTYHYRVTSRENSQTFSLAWHINYPQVDSEPIRVQLKSKHTLSLSLLTGTWPDKRASNHQLFQFRLRAVIIMTHSVHLKSITTHTHSSSRALTKRFTICQSSSFQRWNNHWKSIWAPIQQRNQEKIEIVATLVTSHMTNLTDVEMVLIITLYFLPQYSLIHIKI